MNREPDWTKEEFDLLLRNDALSDEEFSSRLPNRTLDAINVVRNGIHEFHSKGETTLLSKMMKKELENSGIILACPICGKSI